MNTTYKTIILGIISIYAIQSVDAQTAAKDTLLNRQVSLEREYTPTIQDASKINSLPALHEPQKKQYDIRFENAAPTINFSSYPIGDTGSGEIRTDIRYSKQRGYLNFGAGMYSNIEGALGYRIVDGTNDQFDLFGTHNSTNGKIKYLDGVKPNDEVKAKNMENFIKARYSHKFETATWYLSGSFLNNGFNYYGKPYNSALNGDEFIINNIANISKNQSVNIFEIETGLNSVESSDNVNYSASLKYNRFSSKYSTNIDEDGPKGNIIDAKIDLSQPFSSDTKMGIKGNLFFQKYDGHTNNYSEEQNDLYHNLTVLRANPYLKIDNGDVRLLIGANVNWAIDASNKFALAPTIDLGWNFDEKSLLYLTVDGGINDNSFINIYKENRYMNPIGRVDISKTLYDAQLGIRSGVITGFEFDVFAGYKQTNDSHLYLPIYNSASWSNVSDVVYANLGEGHFGGAIKTKLIPYTDLSLKAVAHFYNLNKYSSDIAFSEKKAWGLPSLTFDFNADFSFIENLVLTANYQFEGGRKTWDGLSSVDMKSINELNFKASYHVLEWLSLYAKVNNVLNQKYERYYGYTLQGINASAGFNLIF